MLQFLLELCVIFLIGATAFSVIVPLALSLDSNSLVFTVKRKLHLITIAYAIGNSRSKTPPRWVSISKYAAMGAIGGVVANNLLSRFPTSIHGDIAEYIFLFAGAAIAAYLAAYTDAA
jgi:hypothetical protein